MSTETKLRISIPASQFKSNSETIAITRAITEVRLKHFCYMCYMKEPILFLTFLKIFSSSAKES